MTEKQLDGVFHQACYGHRTDSARHRSDDGSYRLDCLVVHVPAEFAGLRVSVHSDVDDNGSRGYHVGSDETRPADGYDEYLC